MKKSTENKKADIELARIILKEYNCSIQTDDWHSVWLIDNDTNVTVGFNECCT